MISKNIQNIAGYIDHTLLKPFSSEKDIFVLIEEAIKYGFKSVCIPPYFIPFAQKKLKGTDVKVGTIGGFPLGYELSSNKTEMVMRCADAGAQEVDVVINIAAIKSADFDYVSEELGSLATAANIKGILLKIILETCYLTLEEIEKACNLCLENGVPFIKTSTGMGTNGATVEHIEFIKKIVGNKAKIKASGGIKTYLDAIKMIEAGADRLGTSAGVSIISNFQNK